ncbi:MAG: hypothetical protein KA896_11665, partial [Leptothrix sp. (in: Bacteria)]|nr:hypothetical protein [Leptothrix sp. (in: b-proteobacteria)]
PSVMRRENKEAESVVCSVRWQVMSGLEVIPGRSAGTAAIPWNRRKNDWKQIHLSGGIPG